MASSLPEADLTRARELGKYSQATESQSGNERPHEKGRSLTAEEVDIIRKCAGCGKNMRKVKSRFVCFCKMAIHCSKECLKSSKHKCKEVGAGENLPVDKISAEENYERNVCAKFNEVMNACQHRYLADRNADKGPSSDKVTWLLKVTRGEQKRILRYAESGNPTAAYVVGSSYVDRQFDRRSIFTIPLNYEEQSVAETNAIAITWLKVAAEAGIPEAMFVLYTIMAQDCGLLVDRRVADNWLAQAHATGKMEYLVQILELPRGGRNFPTELDKMYNQMKMKDGSFFLGPDLTHLLMAARFWEIKAWGGQTAMEEPFHGWKIFNSIVESIGQVNEDRSKPSFICAKNKTLRFISSRRGHCDLLGKIIPHKRDENNLKFKQGVKNPVSQDFKLVCQTSNLDGRTSYLISCKHDEDKSELELELSESALNKLKSAGKCVFCVEEARQRLRAVSLGLFSISFTPVFGMNDYAARYANEDGILVQDVFGAYSKPCMRQMLQCLMTNPADLHPLAIAEDANLFWPIIWFWGSVYEAVEDACNKATLEAIYHSLGDKSAASQGDKSAASQGDKSAASQGDKSAASQGDKSAASLGDKNAASLGDKNAASQGDKSAASQGDKSAASMGDKSAASLGDKNAASLGDKNAASQGDKSAASQGDKSSDSQGDKRAGSQGDKSADSKSVHASALAAFPEDAAGEWRIACGNDYCPRVDHEVKFNLCAGCGIRRYCDTACQKKDWPRHIKFCKPSKKEGK